jgi:hypothetical protein
MHKVEANGLCLLLLLVTTFLLGYDLFVTMYFGGEEPDENKKPRAGLKTDSNGGLGFDDANGNVRGLGSASLVIEEIA